MSKAETLKSIVKKNVGEKPTFGTDPKDPWSAKANIAEDAALDQYLISRGINPKHVTKDQKVAHSKMGQFIKWKRDHMSEAVDKKDTITFDIPLLIRVLEFAREDLKSDILLHKMVERLLNIRGKGILTMNEYGKIIKEETIDENHVAIAMGNMLDDEGSMVLNQLDDINRCSQMVRDYIGKDYEKQLPAWVQAKITLASDYINTVGTYLASKNEDVKEEVEQVDEVRRGGFTAGWRDEKYFGKGVPTNRPMTDKEKVESQKTKDIQSYLNNLSKNRLKKEDVEPIEEAVMDTLHKIVAGKSAQSVKFASGHRRKVDHYTASAITQVHNAVNDENKKKLADMVHKSPAHFEKVAKFAFSKAK